MGDAPPHYGSRERYNREDSNARCSDVMKQHQGARKVKQTDDALQCALRSHAIFNDTRLQKHWYGLLSKSDCVPALCICIRALCSVHDPMAVSESLCYLRSLEVRTPSNSRPALLPDFVIRDYYHAQVLGMKNDPRSVMNLAVALQVQAGRLIARDHGCGAV